MIYSSSLNVELVYIILKSIIAFSHIGQRDGQDFISNKEITLLNSSKEQDTQIFINSIKVKNIKQWDADEAHKSSSSLRDSTISDSTGSNIENDIKIFNTGVKVTYYYRSVFRKSFAEYMPDLNTIK